MVTGFWITVGLFLLACILFVRSAFGWELTKATKETEEGDK